MTTEERILEITKHTIEIAKKDPFLGSTLRNAVSVALNVSLDIAEEKQTDYLAAFTALTGVSVEKLMEMHLEKNIEIGDVDEEVLDFITGDKETDYKDKLDDLKSGLSSL